MDELRELHMKYMDAKRTNSEDASHLEEQIKLLVRIRIILYACPHPSVFIVYLSIHNKREKSMHHKFHKDFNDHHEMYEKRKFATGEASSRNEEENSGHMRYAKMVFFETILHSLSRFELM